MHEFIQRSDGSAPVYDTLTLPFEARQKSRLRARLDNGEDAALFLERGMILRHGDTLQSREGLVVKINAAAETVSTFYSEEPITLARACYHLGNRHVALQIGEGWGRYLHDHVLDELVRGLGLRVEVEQAPFEPEAGAYQGGGHHHHGHSHGHDHHNHDHPHDG